MGAGKEDKFSDSNGPKSGRVGRLDDDTMGYYRRVADALRETHDNEDDRDLFVKNVFTQLCAEAIKVCQNQTVSRTIEELLYVAKPSEICTLLDVLCLDLETVCTDRFASYVIQTAIVLASQHLEDNDEIGEKVQEQFERVYHFIDAQLGLYVQDTYCSHIVRVIIEILGGQKVDEGIVRSRTSQAFDKVNSKKCVVTLPIPNKQRKQWLENMGHKIMAFGKLKDYCKNYLSNPVVQTFLLVLKERKDTVALNSMLRALITNVEMFQNEPGTNVPELASHTVGSRLVELVVTLSDEELQCQLYDRHLRSHILHWALHPTANFVVQRLLVHVISQKMFESLYDEVCDNLEDIMADNHVGVVVAMAEGALKHGTRQKALIKCLQETFHCYEPEERRIKLAPLLLSLTTYDVFYKLPDIDTADKEDSDQEEDSDKELEMPSLKEINYHGSVIMQKLIGFGSPMSVVSSLLQMSPGEINCLACNPCGSHVIDAFVNSDTVGEKSREGLVNRIKGYFMLLATDKNGSRAFDSIWGKASIKSRTIIAEELVKQEAALRGNRFGHFIWSKYALQTFKDRRHEWKDIQTGQMKKRKHFQDILALDNKESVKKKSKKSRKDEDEDIEEDSNLRLQLSDDEGAPVAPASPPKEKKKKKKKERKEPDAEDDVEQIEEIIDTEHTEKKKKKKKNKEKLTEKIETEEIEVDNEVSDSMEQSHKVKEKKKRKKSRHAKE